MTVNYTSAIFVNVCLLIVLTGCATGPQTHTDKRSVSEITDESLDILFATEFPVESEAEAMARAAQAFQNGDADKALFFYVRALKFRPDNVELMAHIGNIHMRRNNLAMAKRVFLAARALDDHHAPTLESLGLIYMNEGLDEKAILALQSAVANDSQRWRAYGALGVYADKAGDFAAAQAHYDVALSINPKAAHVLNNRGYSKYLAGDNNGAARDFYEAAKNQGFEKAWANLGRVYANQGWYDSAIETYKEVMSEAHALNNTAEAAIDNGDYAQARLYLNKAIHLSPTYFPAAEDNLVSLNRR